MPLRYIRSRLTTTNVLTLAVTTTTITRELADMAQFPPARAAASVLLLIFETIQNVQTNRSECYRLARRCLSLLVDMKDQMVGRWEDAPQSLLRNFAKLEKTLEAIHEFMTKEADNKWRTRLMRKTTIEEALSDFNTKLDDAARTFQIVTLINIQLALGTSGTSAAPLIAEQTTTPACIYSEPTDLIELTSSPISIQSSASFANIVDLPDERDSDVLSQRSLSDEFVLVSDKSELTSSIARAVPAALPDPELELLDHRGFRRYHQSHAQLKSRSRQKSGWWANSVRGRVDGRDVLIKSYEGPKGDMAKKWVRDVKILQNVYHPNLPQMVGYSNDETPTPFILLASVQMRLPQALILDTIENASLASCAVLLLRLYRDTLDAALYVQRQLNLSETKTQDYVENTSYIIDDEGRIIMGLPPPEIANWESWRNYGLVHSIRDIYMRILPNRGYVNQPHEPNESKDVALQQKISHLAVLARALLPDDAAASEVSSRLSAILDADEDEENDGHVLSLRQIRLAALSSKSHEQTWKQNTVPAFKFCIGDLGYIPPGKDFDSFCVLQNVVADGLALFNLVHDAIGWQGSWSNGFRTKQDLQPFPAPYNVSGWAAVVPPSTTQEVQIIHETCVTPPSTAWKFLLDHGKSLAEAHGIEPHDLMLVTRVGTDQQFRIHDLRSIPFMRPQPVHNPHQFTSHPAFGPSGMHQRPGFGHHSHGHFGGHQQHYPPMNSFLAQQLQPLIFYLFTSPDKEHEPYWSESPMHQLLPKGVERPELRARCAPSVGWNHGFLNYVQLHREDFLAPPSRRLTVY